MTFVNTEHRSAMIFDILWQEPRHKMHRMKTKFYGSCPKIDNILLNLGHHLTRLNNNATSFKLDGYFACLNDSSETFGETFDS